MRAWAVLLLLGLALDAAHADRLNASFDQPLRETAHRVELRLVEGMALYRVRRTLVNDGKKAEQAHLAIAMPVGGVATGLRVLQGGTWVDARLADRAQANGDYDDGGTAAPQRTAAMLAWEKPHELILKIHPIAPRGSVSIEYTLLAPTTYASGRYWASYPRAREYAERGRLAIPELRVQATGAIEVNGVARLGGEAIALDDGEEARKSGMRRDDGIGSATSQIELVAPAAALAKRAIAVQLELDHAAPEDLALELIGPSQRIQLRDAFDRAPLQKRYDLEVPREAIAGAWRLEVSDHAAGDTGVLRGWSIASRDGIDAFEGRAADTPIAIPDGYATPPDDDRQNAIAIAAPVAAPWVARYSQAPTGDGAAIARLELDVARAMAPLPRRAQVAFVIDASRSISDRDMHAQRALVAQYLAHVPDAEVEIVVMRRHAKRLLGSFVDGKAALAALDRPGALERENGSALDEALALAAQAIAARPGPRRIVIMTDELLATRLAAPAVFAALARLAPDDVVHLVASLDASLTAPADLPRRKTALTPLARMHHGIHVWRWGAIDGKSGAGAVLELVRPTRLEALRVDGAVAEVDNSALPFGSAASPGKARLVDELREGDGLRAIAHAAAPRRTLRITGMLWSDPVELTATVDARWTAQTAALAFGSEAYSKLTPAAQATLAKRGRAVSPVTSYLVTAAGARPTDMFGVVAGESSDRPITIGAGHASSAPPPPPLRDLIDPSACVQRVRPPASWRVALEIETTRAEIVDVIGAASDAMTACLIETAWQVRLPASYGERQRHRVELGR